MATAGTPESASPASARNAISAGQFGAKAVARVAAAAAASEAAITDLCPKASDSAPAPNMATASTAVVADTERLAAAGETEKASTKAGSSGCTQ